ncbi:MAG: RNA polymerase sigma factor [Clostridia bacterium]|nr:RNA polymerase sigma factor [Clostridia bacterium]
MDELLLRRARDGDEEAFEKLITPLEGLVWRVCWHYTGNREDASDCGQEAMVRVWRYLDGYRGDCAFESWVYRIAANVCLDFLRRRKRERQVPLEPMKEQGFDPPDPAPGTEEQAVAREEKERLRSLIAQLPEEQRDALVLTQLEGKSYQEVAALLGVSEGTVKSRVNRARTRLKEQMEETGKPPERRTRA